MKLILFSIAFVFELIYILMFIMTIRGRGFRFWPPPSHRSWQFFVSWFLASVIAVNFIFLGLLDFDSFWLPSLWLRSPVPLAMFLFAFAIGIWIEVVFPFHATIGLGNRLITNGPYRFSRNPQYLVDSLSALGYMILTNSWMVWVIGTLGVILNILAPYTEEPWLEERFGDEYREYKARVPRFIRLGKRG
ncbi:MAG: isoprenylcysteine carboxylmethyltransferase family protein [Anaerolineaceae bacterium]|jgi:protein-S-isoprenylcysteine O-methyltransferase Ste14